MVDTMEEKVSDHNLFEDIEQSGHLVNQEEYDTTALKAIRDTPWVILWCAYAIWMLILNSFDNQAGMLGVCIPINFILNIDYAGGAVISIPEFRKDFGYAYEDSYVLPVAWQSAFSGAPVAS